MMKKWLLIVVVLLGTACADARADIADMAALPPCWPSNLGGSGTAVVSIATASGQAMGWWCVADGQPRRWGITWLQSYRLRHPERVSGSTPAQVAEAYWRENVTHTNSRTPEMLALSAALHERLLDSRPAPPPPPPPAPRYAVAPIQAAGKPAGQAAVYLYVPVGGAGAQVWQTGSVPFGAACDCGGSAAKPLNATEAYCPAPAISSGMPGSSVSGLLARCVQQP